MDPQFRERTAAYDALPAQLPVKVQIHRANVKSLQVGDWAEVTKRFGPESVDLFASLSEDRNPLHLSPKFAATTRFKRPIAHGMLTASLFSGLLGLHLPGKGSVYLQQTVKFRAPAFVGSSVTARVTIVKIRTDKPIVTLSTEARDSESGKVLVAGEAVILAPRRLVAELQAKL